MSDINFEKMSLEDNIDIVKWSYYSEGYIHDYTINLFPELSSFEKGKLSEQDKDKELEKVVKDYYDKYLEYIASKLDEYKKEWSKYNDVYFNTLKNYLNTELPNKDITCYVGIIPIYPRNINDNYFAISTKVKDEEFLRVCAHEILHFLWFKKWQSMYPKTSKKEFNAPYLPWKYSEMITDPILNSKEIQKVFNHKFKEFTYDEFYLLEYNKENVMKHLVSIWQKNINIEDKIIEGYEYIKLVFYEKEK